MKRRMLASLARSQYGREQLWKIWWLCGIPVAWITSAMVIGGEAARVAEYPVAADWLDVLRILIYTAWARLAWLCAGNVELAAWSPVSRFALTAGLLLMVLV